VQHHQPTPTTIAVLGSDTVVGSALSALLEGSGYRIRLLESYPSGVVDELLAGADLLMLTPRVDEGVREAVLGAMGKKEPHKAHMPVIALSTATTIEEGPKEEGVFTVPWPSKTEDLVERIEAALLVQAPSTTADAQ
jgi:hypothetical protein